MKDENFTRAELAKCMSSSKPAQIDQIIRALQVLPQDKQGWVVENVFYFSTYGKRYGSRMSRGLCQTKEVIFISEKAFPQVWDINAIESKFFVFLVLHETAHAIRLHKCRIYDGLSDEQYNKQEQEATSDAIAWFNDYATENNVALITEVDVEKYKEKLDSLVDEWEWTWEKHLQRAASRE